MSVYNDSFKQTSETLDKTMEQFSKLQTEYIKTTFSSDPVLASFSNLQETIVASYRQMFQSCIQIVNESTIRSMNQLSEQMVHSLYESFYHSLKNSPAFQSLNLDTVRLTPKLLNVSSSSSKSEGISDAGTVILNASAVEIFNLPESVATTTSPGRRKISAIDFIKLIICVISVLSDLHSLLSSTSSDSEAKMLQVEEVQTELLQSGNQFLSDLFQDIDLSLSNVSGSLQSLKETVEEQSSEFSSLKESVDLLQENIDNMNKSENTAPESK